LHPVAPSGANTLQSTREPYEANRTRLWASERRPFASGELDVIFRWPRCRGRVDAMSARLAIASCLSWSSSTGDGCPHVAQIPARRVDQPFALQPTHAQKASVPTAFNGSACSSDALHERELPSAPSRIYLHERIAGASRSTSALSIACAACSSRRTSRSKTKLVAAP
jgi:hypothetical protein